MNENNSIIPVQQNGILPRVSNSIKITNKILAKAEEILIPYRKKDKWGFCTPDKKIVIDCIYELAKQFSEGFSVVKLNNKCGFINTLNEIVIPFDYDKATTFRDNISYVALNKNLYKINKNNELELVRPRYEWEWWSSPMDVNFEESHELLLQDIGRYLRNCNELN
jgi:hypothetical protein